MERKIKIFLLVPLLIAGSIATMLLSYLLVPMIVVATAFVIATISRTTIDENRREIEQKAIKKYKKGKYKY
jgi:phosphate/sulfate permease